MKQKFETQRAQMSAECAEKSERLRHKGR